MKKVYIAGKITGDLNFKKKFEDAKLKFEALGYVVLNPAELPGRMSPADYMRICFAMVDSSDILYFLPDYIDSPGAQLEHRYAGYIGKECIFVIPNMGV